MCLIDLANYGSVRSNFVFVSQHEKVYYLSLRKIELVKRAQNAVELIDDGLEIAREIRLVELEENGQIVRNNDREVLKLEVCNLSNDPLLRMAIYGWIAGVLIHSSNEEDGVRQRVYDVS